MTVQYLGDPEYANAKLTDSVITLGEGLAYILRVESDDRVIYNLIGDRSNSLVKPLSDFDLTPIKLGYLNFKSTCSYLARIPARHYRQGLRGATLVFQTELRGFGLLSCKELSNTAMGIFPSVMDCYEEIICGEAVARAFCRDFALMGDKKTIALSFKGKKVGGCSWGDRGPQFFLPDQFRFLNEMLMESVDGRKSL